MPAGKHCSLPNALIVPEIEETRKLAARLSLLLSVRRHLRVTFKKVRSSP
jgi:hypothetical protein